MLQGCLHSASCELLQAQRSLCGERVEWTRISGLATWMAVVAAPPPTALAALVAKLTNKRASALDPALLSELKRHCKASGDVPRTFQKDGWKGRESTPRPLLARPIFTRCCAMQIACCWMFGS